ncbi:MAG: hypothetical protein HY868_12340 [Chloroflexi bacterium]|nr:hypothetical protein [Chloroflexota bacterium]
MRHLAFACQQSTLVESFSVASSDEDTLSVRVILSDQSFIHVYYNIARNKTAFAWIRADKRIYGKDNTRMGWHRHPFDDPSNHQPCDEIDFASFLRELELYWYESQTKEMN